MHTNKKGPPALPSDASPKGNPQGHLALTISAKLPYLLMVAN